MLRDTPVLEMLCLLAQERVREQSALGLANTAWSAAVLEIQSEVLMKIIAS